MNTEITRENTCISAACTNDLYDEFSTLKFSKMISNANGSHDNYRKILDPYPHEVSLEFRWVPNGWKLKPIELTPTNVSVDQLFLDKVEPI